MSVGWIIFLVFSRAYVSLGTICRRFRDAGTESFDKFPRASILNLGRGKRRERIRETMLESTKNNGIQRAGLFQLATF